MGSNTYHACNYNPINSCYSGSGGGTSYSCPLVAGASALLLEVDPSLTPMQLATLLKNTASLSNNPNNQYGWGIINTYAAVQLLITDTGKSDEIPEDFYLFQNYPNPFNPSTIIRINIPVKSDVKLVLYDILGREIKTLLNEEMNPGTKEIAFNGNDLTTGVYLVRMTADNYQQTIKISLVK
jgi:hypothetical protein